MKVEDAKIGDLFLYIYTNEPYLYLEKINEDQVKFLYLRENNIFTMHESYFADFEKFDIDEENG